MKITNSHDSLNEPEDFSSVTNEDITGRLLITHSMFPEVYKFSFEHAFCNVLLFKFQETASHKYFVAIRIQNLCLLAKADGECHSSWLHLSQVDGLHLDINPSAGMLGSDIMRTNSSAISYEQPQGATEQPRQQPPSLSPGNSASLVSEHSQPDLLKAYENALRAED